MRGVVAATPPLCVSYPENLLSNINKIMCLLAALAAAAVTDSVSEINIVGNKLGYTE